MVGCELEFRQEADIGFSVEVESLQSENWSAEQLGSI